MEMKMNSNDMNEMTRILSGEATLKERDHFYEVLDADPDKKHAFEIMEKEWIAASDAMLYKSLDVDAAWQRHKNEYLGLEGNEKKSSPGMVWKWAAVIVAAAGLAFYFITNRVVPVEHFTKISTGSSETLPVSMADGSTITLNQNSTLAYNFNEETRRLNFEGEAYFEVATDPDRPFVIEMEEAYIKVIGTAFNVKTNGLSIDVAVKEGLVEFGLKDRSEKTWIEAGSMGKLYDRQLSKTDVLEPNVISWYTKELVFEQSPLTDVLSDIAGTYHVNFRYDVNKLKNCHLTADFSKEELTNVLETLHTIFKVDFRKDENTYVVTGKPCE